MIVMVINHNDVFTILIILLKVSLATDFMYNYLSRDVTASVGYDYILRQVSFQMFFFSA